MMRLVLNVYTDDSLTELKRVVEADQLKIPYRVAVTVAQSLEDMDFKDNEDILKFVSKNLEKVDKIIKATFGITDSELECIDILELGKVAMDIYNWGLGLINKMGKGDHPKNLQETV